jgi:hypothetical protein
LPPPWSQNAIVGAEEVYGTHGPIEPGLLTHLTRLTRLCTRRDLQLPNDPAALPSAGASLRVLELASDLDDERGLCVEALLPVAAGLEALDIGEARLTAADAARLAAALPREIARLRIASTSRRDSACVWAALPLTHLELYSPPADLALLAGASRLELLSVSTVSGAEPAALAAALQALPRLRALQLGSEYLRAFEPPPTAHYAAPVATAPAGTGAQDAAPPTAEAVDAFVAAVAGLPFLRELSLTGFHVGDEAKAALLKAAPRLSSLRLFACLSDEAAAGLAAQLRAAGGRCALSLEERARGARR